MIKVGFYDQKCQKPDSFNLLRQPITILRLIILNISNVSPEDQINYCKLNAVIGIFKNNPITLLTSK